MDDEKVFGHEHRVFKTEKMLLLEQKHGKPIDDLIIEAYNKYGFRGTWEFLGITSGTLNNWLKDLDIVTFKGAAKRGRLEELGLKVEPKQQPEQPE